MRMYSAVFKFARTRPDQVAICTVVVAPAGQLLRASEFEQRYERTRQAYIGRGPNYLRSEFPQIGKRAQLDILTFGPGGASSGLTFTTTDTRFDVRVIWSNLLPSGAPPFKCNIESLARTISGAYDRIEPTKTPGMP